jgi:GDP-D-mannose dehydratase
MAPISPNILGIDYIVHGVKRRSSWLSTAWIDHLYEDPRTRNTSTMFEVSRAVEVVDQNSDNRKPDRTKTDPRQFSLNK